MTKEKEIRIGLDITKKGQIVIDTELEEIPTEVAQKILDEVLSMVITAERHRDDFKEDARPWKILSIGQLIIIIIAILKAKGVL